MFAGLLCVGGARSPGDLVGPEALLATLAPYHQPSATGVWCDGPFLLVQATEHDEVDRAGGRPVTLPQRCTDSGRVVAFWGRLDDREALTRALGRPDAAATDQDLVLAAFDRWGASCPEHLTGDFVGVVCDPKERRTLLFRDRLGVKPLYYLSGDGFLFFATTAAVFGQLGRHAPAPDLDWAARLLAGVNHGHTDTALTGVVKVAPGHTLDVHPGGTRLARYHHWRDDPPWTLERDAARVEAYREALEEAVRCRMRGAERIGSENSGGLDSSTVTAYLARFLGDPGDRLCAFGWALCDLEPEYIIETSRHAGILYNYVLTARGRLTDAEVERGLTAVGYPEQAGDAVGHIPFYEECQRRGIGTLFSGFGGDEGVTNSGSLLGRELLDHRAYGALWRLMPGRSIPRGLRVARARVLRRRWGAGHPLLRAAMKARWPHQLVRTETVQRLGLFGAYMDQAEFDAPYRRINDSVLHHRLGPWVSRRLETSTLVAATYGVEYRYPLLDARLIQQFLSTPSIEKADRCVGRYLHRRAVERVVPAKVAWKPDKDMGEVRSSGDRTAAVVAEARRQEAHLHAGLDELIDGDRFRGQIKAAADGQLPSEAAFQFRRNVDHVRWLNHWLSGAPPPA